MVRRAGERPEIRGRRLSQGDGHALARQLSAEARVEDLAAATVRRMLAAQPLQPWRQPLGRHPTPPRAAGFYATVAARIELSTRPLRAAALVLALEEPTSLPPRPRPSPPLPAQPHHQPNRRAHADQRAGALNRCAAWETRSGPVDGPCDARTRPAQGLAFLAHLDREIPASIRTMPRVCDHVRTPPGPDVTRWIAKHPRVVVHFPPGPCAWMNPVEPWCSSWPRQRFRMVDVSTKDHRRVKREQFIGAGHQQAHPFNWSVPSVAQVMAEAPALAA